MRSQCAGNQSSAEGQRRRNPFDVMDVPNPNDQEVQEFATGITLEGTPDDGNARHKVPSNIAVNPTPSKDVGPAGGMGVRTPRSPGIAQTNGNRVKPK
jgi:hypothetical protein